MLIASVVLQTLPLISDTSVHEIVQAGVGVLALAILALVFWTIVKPLIANKGREEDGDAKNFGLLIQQNARTLDVMDANQKDTHALIGKMADLGDGIQTVIKAQKELISAVTQLVATDTERTAANIVNHDEITIIRSVVTEVPRTIEAQHSATIEKVTEAMTQAFEIRDEKFQQILVRMDTLEEKFAANEAVSEDTRTLVREVKQLLLDARAVDKADTGSLEGRIATGSDAARAPLKVEATVHIAPPIEPKQEK